MNAVAASLKQFKLLSNGLSNASLHIRKESLKAVRQIAEVDATLAERSLDTLASYIVKNRFSYEPGRLFWALNEVNTLPPQLVVKSPKLLTAVLKASLERGFDASTIASICLKIVESDELPKSSSHLQAIIEKSKSAMSTGGQRDFGKIVDWAKNNGMYMPACSGSKVTGVKARTGRRDPRAKIRGKQITSVQSDVLLPQNGFDTTPFVLDHDQIREKQVESEIVSEYLGQIFNPEDAENAQALVAANSSVEGRVALRGLEPILFAFALRLASRATWKRADAESLAASLGLMFDGALEQLNDASLDEWGVLFAEGEDSVELNAAAIAGLAMQS